MPKTQGIKVRIDAFLPIDKKDFAKQAKTYAAMDVITKTKQLPADFWSSAVILDVTAAAGSAEVPAKPINIELLKADPASIPLTTDPLPEGATVLATVAALDETHIQHIKLADGTEQARRISGEQFKKENPKGK